MTRNIILSIEETKAFLVNHQENNNGEGRNHGSLHEEMRSPKGFVFSSTWPHNHPNLFIR